jgi:Kef-type K+ transport system membrane component KefB
MDSLVHMHALSASFFLQMAIILVVCRLVGIAAKRIGQPQVVGEMIAGVMLGPSLLGLIWPGSTALIFTQESRGILYAGAQLGVGLYMFLVGLEFRTDHFRKRARSAASVSIAGMVVPFILGGLLVLWLIDVPGIFMPKVRYYEGALFLGAAIAITAFPMLARIISERGLSGAPLGTLTLAAGAIDDAAAWCVLAIVLASFGASQSMQIGGISIGAEVIAIGGSVLYGTLMLTVGKKLLAGLGRKAEREGDDGGYSGAVLCVGVVCGYHRSSCGVRRVYSGYRHAARCVCRGHPPQDRTLRCGFPAADVLYLLRSQYQTGRSGGSQIIAGWLGDPDRLDFRERRRLLGRRPLKW